MIFYENGGKNKILTNNDLKKGIAIALEKMGKINKALIIPPDITRKHSKAGILTSEAANILRNSYYRVLPALGTHIGMTASELNDFFPGIDHNKFLTHSWRNDITEKARIPAEFISKITNGKLSFDWPIQINKNIVEKKWDLILSIGQVVPHEVTGFANHSKNILIGTGGEEGIHKSHYIGAVCGMEKIIGKIDTPVRKLLNHASEEYLNNLPIVYALTVIETGKTGENLTRGLFIGTGYECFKKAATLSQKVNIKRIKKTIKRAVVYLDPAMYRSTWLGNKAIYRLRMAIESGGELTIIAPGIRHFGEDPTIDNIIRKYGYCGTENILSKVNKNTDIQNNLCAAAHLIHGSSENRFKITYACNGLTKQEINSVGYEYITIKDATKLLAPKKLKNGFNIDKQGNEFYFVNNPAMGLWI